MAHGAEQASVGELIGQAVLFAETDESIEDLQFDLLYFSQFQFPHEMFLRFAGCLCLVRVYRGSVCRLQMDVPALLHAAFGCAAARLSEMLLVGGIEQHEHGVAAASAMGDALAFRRNLAPIVPIVCGEEAIEPRRSGELHVLERQADGFFEPALLEETVIVVETIIAGISGNELFLGALPERFVQGVGTKTHDWWYAFEMPVWLFASCL